MSSNRVSTSASTISADLPQLFCVYLYTDFRGRHSLCKGRNSSFLSKPSIWWPALTTVVGGHQLLRKLSQNPLHSLFHLSVPTSALSASAEVGFEKWETASNKLDSSHKSRMGLWWHSKSAQLLGRWCFFPGILEKHRAQGMPTRSAAIQKIFH